MKSSAVPLPPTWDLGPSDHYVHTVYAAHMLVT
jgi:hypothetical protein